MLGNFLINSLFMIILFVCQIHLSKTRPSSEDNLSVERASVIFRHGERETITSSQYAMLASLTNVGKLQAFEYGIWLREHYPALLKKNYDFEELYVRSSGVSRSVMTAESVLVGLYYPLDTKDQWSGKYNVAWSPIPVSNVPQEYDEMLYPSRESYCPVMENIYSERLSALSEKYPNIAQSSFGSVSEYFTNNPQVEAFMEELFDTLNSNLAWRRLYSGPVLKDIVEKFRSSQTTMNLYAAHDYNIVNLIYALDFENETSKISFLSSIIFELVVDNETSNSYIKILLKNGPNSEAVVQKMKSCEELCPFDKFQQILEPLIPGDWFEECQEVNTSIATKSKARAGDKKLAPFHEIVFFQTVTN